MEVEGINAKSLKNDWALALMSQGIIVKLSLRRWSGKASLNFNDLGLKFVDDDASSFVKKYISLGTQKLLPPEVINAIQQVEYKARGNLQQHSFNTVWGKFVPYTAFESWENRNDQIRSDYYDFVKVLGQNYNEVVEEVRNDYGNMARDVWARLYPDQGNAPSSFIEDFLNKITSKIPPYDQLIKSFSYDVAYFIIPMPSFVEDNLSKARDIERDREQKEFEAVLERSAKRKVAEEYEKRKVELIDNFLENTVLNMRKEIAALCDSVLTSMGKSRNIKFTKTHSRKLKVMIEKVKLLNFHNDKDITTLINDLEIEIDKFKGERDNNIVAEKLEKIVKVGSEEFVPDFNPITGYLDLEI